VITGKGKRRRSGQFSLIIGAFLLAVIIVLTISMYLMYNYYKRNAEENIEKLTDLTRYITVPYNTTISNRKTVIYVKGRTDKILTGVAYCVNSTATRTVVKMGKIYSTSGEVSTDCVANDSLNLTLEYTNYRRQRIRLLLNPRHYRTLLYIEGTNSTLNATLAVIINVFQSFFLGAEEVYNNISTISMWNLEKVYNTDLIYVRDIPVYYYASPRNEIMYTYEIISNTPSSRGPDTYYYVNESVTTLVRGSGSCTGLANRTLIGVYPSDLNVHVSQLANCTVDRVMVISQNITRAYLGTRTVRTFNISLVRFLSLNQITSYSIVNEYLTFGVYYECNSIGYNKYLCDIVNTFPENVVYMLISFNLNSTGISSSLLTLIRNFINSTIEVNITLPEFSIGESVIELIGYVRYVNPLTETSSIAKVFNITITCRIPLFSITYTCNVERTLYSGITDVANMLTPGTRVYFDLVDYFYNVLETRLLISFDNVTILPMR